MLRFSTVTITLTAAYCYVSRDFKKKCGPLLEEEKHKSYQTLQVLFIAIFHAHLQTWPCTKA
jgi:hypothetical protein